MTDQPRLFRDPNEVAKRETEIDLPHGLTLMMVE